VSSLHIEVSHGSPVPIYHQISEQLQSAIERGALTKGDFLPSEIELAARWGVSRPTARRAIQELVDRGMLVRKRGVGTQVVNAQLRRAMRLSSLHGDLMRAGRKPSTIIRAFTLQPADQQVAEALEVTEGSSVHYLERLRLANGEPLALMHNWLITPLLADTSSEDLQTTGLYEVLASRRVRPRLAQQVISSKAASQDEAAVLNLPQGAPLLAMRRVMQDDTGRVVELGDHVYDAGRYSVEMIVMDG
jgi:DNA-binding GntR family transcriptional regulator